MIMLMMTGVSYTDPRKGRFRNAVSGCVLPRKNFRNGVPARFVTKIPPPITEMKGWVYFSTAVDDDGEGVLRTRHQFLQSNKERPHAVCEWNSLVTPSEARIDV
jgi:hypothetical protein